MLSRITAVLFLLTTFLPAHSQTSANFEGIYQFNPEVPRLFMIKADSGSLWLHRGASNEHRLRLAPVSGNRYRVDMPSPEVFINFQTGAGNEAAMLVEQGGGKFECFRIRATTDMPQAGRLGNRQNGFTRADTLRGKLSPERSCYDVNYYHLTVDIDPGKRFLSGSTLIRFNAMAPFNRLQVDLYEQMAIDRIVYKGKPLAYTREFNAVFVTFPKTFAAGEQDEFEVFYHGHPQEPDLNASMHGGFLWRMDDNRKPFIQVACQGSGASLWWPNKDHLSDEPDSMRITVTVPEGLQNISNGRLQRKETLPDKRNLTEWLVSYPINNYNVTVNIGDYQHLSDTLGALTLDYYYLPNHRDSALKLFKETKPMLRFMQEHFGPYPFQRDGFRLIETPHPMEHQSIVAMGGLGGGHEGMRRLMWHESAHEWWGNNVSVKDLADFWLHEGFASYTEMLGVQLYKGEKEGLKTLKDDKPANREPVIGERDVNHIHYSLWDVYGKGARIVMMLRAILNNDEQFFSLLQGIQQEFRFKTVTTNDITGYIIRRTGLDLQSFFDQYLLSTKVPELELMFRQEGADLELRYKWNNVTDNFRMPVRANITGERPLFLDATGEWKTLRLKSRTAKDFIVDTDHFYVTVKKTGD
ncbi:M1 family metallopeptidase [Chitinophaga sp. GCM10012297]|uniref:M1 family metallopeptidase n=1 Tax=Chitinophaga chungangae TaxID=2821488 RepID=A0ABS3YHK5_9BACT|nr:M1 family metallopeptidase [Chitinophaga chungangae]MBO9154172.1 M1 family metallopeptidase [Chitinophaga chungangae]